MSRDPPARKCYTIGYGNMPVEKFIATLQCNGIDTVVDVRTNPYSRFRPEYTRETLQRTLAHHGIAYHFMGDMLGGRYTDPALLRPDGSVDYGKVRGTEMFRVGIRRLVALIDRGKTVAVMCAEKEPERCHRWLLVGAGLVEQNVTVVNL